jgi:hypothetical protein
MQSALWWYCRGRYWFDKDIGSSPKAVPSSPSFAVPGIAADFPFKRGRQTYPLQTASPSPDALFAMPLLGSMEVLVAFAVLIVSFAFWPPRTRAFARRGWEPGLLGLKVWPARIHNFFKRHTMVETAYREVCTLRLRLRGLILASTHDQYSRKTYPMFCRHGLKMFLSCHQSIYRTPPAARGEAERFGCPCC